MAGASPTKSDDVLIVVDNDYERRYFYSANRATNGLHWLNQFGDLKVYRLDNEASNTLTLEIRKALKTAQTDPTKGYNWTKAAAERFKAIFQNCTGIRRA